MNCELSIILIAHNEEQVIGSMIEGLLKYYDNEILEILVVDDASIDNTVSIVISCTLLDKRVRLLKKGPPCGVGRTLITGFKNVNNDAKFILTMDSDFVKNISEVRYLIDAIESKKYDGVIGSRFIKKGSLVGYPIIKKIMNFTFHILVRNIFRIKQKDLTNNFKLYKAHIFKELPWVSKGYSINAETGIFPILAGYYIGEVPVSWIKRDLQMGKSKFSLLRSGLGYIKVFFYSFKFFINRCNKFTTN